MINREDMLELTRRMTPKRASITRVAGCYVDQDGEFNGSFNINFLKLSGAEKTKNLKMAKAADKERLWESEEVFEYLICVICPLVEEYEPGEPECGFLFPSFTDRSGDLNHVNVFQKNPGKPHIELSGKILGAE